MYALRNALRFTPLATVPPQDGKLAADVLGEAVDKDFGGAMIGTLPKGIGGGNLDDPSPDPFWDTASKLGAVVYLHPTFICGNPRKVIANANSLPRRNGCCYDGVAVL